MSQKIVTNYSGSFLGDEALEMQGGILAAAIAKAVEDAEQLGGEDQKLEQVTFELDDSLQFHSGGHAVQPFTLQIVSTLR